MQAVVLDKQQILKPTKYTSRQYKIIAELLNDKMPTPKATRRKI